MKQGLFILFLFSILVCNGTPFSFDGSQESYCLKQNVYFLNDSSGKLKLNDLKRPEIGQQFKASEQEMILYGIHPIWIKFSLENKASEPYCVKIGLIGTLKLDVYMFNSDGKFEKYETGILRPLENKAEQLYYFVFNVPKGATDFYARVETWELGFVPVELIKKSKVQFDSNLNYIFNGIYIGVILLVSAFCIYYYLVFKELIYLAYIGWMISTGLFMFFINGVFNEFIAQNYLRLNLLYPAALMVSTFFYMVFITVFLKLKSYSRLLYFLFYGVAMIQIILLGAFCIGYNTFQITQFLGSIFNMVVLGSAVYVLIKGHAPAKYLILATLVVFIGGAISVLAINSVIPLTPLSGNALQLSLIVEIFLFTMGLVEKSYSLKQETIATQSLIIQVMHENERIIQENTLNLEKSVSERTKEIAEQNHELKQQHEELKILNERVHEQNELLDGQNIQLKNYNDKLEERVEERTQQLKMSSEKLMVHYKKLEQYTYITSHNLRGPIARLLGLHNILDQSKIEDNESLVILKHMQNTALAMDVVVKDLAKILEINNKKNDDYSEVNLVELFNSIKQTLNVKEVEDLKLVGDFSIAPTIFSVKPYIQSLFYNLMSNSIKYRFPFRPLEITVRSLMDENGIILQFIDNGLGINLKEAEPKLFQPFQRFHEQHIDGTGFGLFLVKLQLENLGGNIQIESEVNVGTKITVFLPFEKSVPIG